MAAPNMIMEGTKKLIPQGGFGHSAVLLAQNEEIMAPKILPTAKWAFQIPIISPRL